MKTSAEILEYVNMMIGKTNESLRLATVDHERSFYIPTTSGAWD